MEVATAVRGHYCVGGSQSRVGSSRAGMGSIVRRCRLLCTEGREESGEQGQGRVCCTHVRRGGQSSEIVGRVAADCWHGTRMRGRQVDRLLLCSIGLGSSIGTLDQTI